MGLKGVGAWRSLVARTVRVGEVAGSNPAAPIDEQAAFLAGVSGALTRRRREKRYRPTLARRVRAVACMPNRFGCRGAAGVVGAAGSTHRTVGSSQASWPIPAA